MELQRSFCSGRLLFTLSAEGLALRHEGEAGALPAGDESLLSANGVHNELQLAFSAELSKLTAMNFAAYSYYWRFTYRTIRERGASV